jgi:hypothetical protein
MVSVGVSKNNRGVPWLKLSDEYLSSIAFIYDFGSGSLNYVTDVKGPGVAFAVSALGKLGISDNFWGPRNPGDPPGPSPLSGLAQWSGFYCDATGFKGIMMQVKNLGTAGVNVNLYINTGFTDSPWNSPNTFWQSKWTYIPAGETRVLKLDFSYAEAWQGSTNFFGPVSLLYQVTNIGFQVADWNSTTTNTLLEVRGIGNE